MSDFGSIVPKALTSCLELDSTGGPAVGNFYEKFWLYAFRTTVSCQFFIPAHNETLSVVAMRVHNPDCPGLYPVIRNSLVGLAPYLGKFRALNQIGEFDCHSFFSELRPLPVVVQ